MRDAFPLILNDYFINGICILTLLKQNFNY